MTIHTAPLKGAIFQEKQWNRLSRWLMFLAIALFVSGCQRATFVSSSMLPTIKPGEKVTMDYTAYAVASPRRWDVVGFEPTGHTNEIWLMRVVGLPSESVAFTSGGVTVNGKALDLPLQLTNVTYLSIDRLGQPSSIKSPCIVPAGSYFVLGDNSANAYDSRFMGPISRSQIIGRIKDK